ncbi:Di-copper centre-containing protein [Lentithecium fluviatile CBS 122367]|uniref:Di-copper centre-containing protein n=1 Tax=Lentithecium fluviatile CBS 122367 TaxID=1168545 RepID=A0A6G1INJ0_9PLEO|nr:Di-copper centre-containing protein [Lentithecium fluviatile CBS 122367]
MAPLLRAIVFLCFASGAMSACTTKGKRRAWHTLSNAEKLEYINAELCLMQKPAKLSLPGCKTRFDELQAVHQLQAYATHFVGAFLPFHRLLMKAHEEALRSECGYTGYQPYWQEQLDAGKFSTSAIFDKTYGFGGDGSGRSNCITTGPFSNYSNHLGPGYQVTDHCIDRKISNQMSTGSAQREVDRCLQLDSFATAWPCIEGQPHTGGHGGVGGQMLNGVSSPGDPLFYLHHTWLDKIWADWQSRDQAKRVKDISGTNIQPDNMPGFPARPSNIPKPTGAAGDPGTTTTLGHVLDMKGNSPNKTITDVMDVAGEVLCIEYVDP